MSFARTFTFGCTAILLTGSAALAQETCSTYTVKVGDNLRFIARAAYGDGDMYRVIYDANVAVIGAKADIIEIGSTLQIPCDPNATETAAATTDPAEEPAVETVTQVAATPEAAPAPAAAVPAETVKPIGFVTGNGYAPFADETLPGGGMMTQLVEMAVFRADPAISYNLTFINDALLPSGA
jgi:hypothetical protein